MLAVEERSAARRVRPGDERCLHALELLARDRSSVVERGEPFELPDGITGRSRGRYF
jgi:hypothetical protein